MVFLKGLLFIVLNVGMGSLLIYSINWFLFNPKQRNIFGVRNPLTPGFLVRKREWLFVKARDLLHGYLEQAADKTLKDGYLAGWEEQIRKAVWEKTGFIDGWAYLPNAWKQKIHETLANIVKDICSMLLRKVVPHYVEQFRLEHKIDELDELASIAFFYKYYRKYVYVPLLLIFLVLNFLAGLMDMILFIIIR